MSNPVKNVSVTLLISLSLIAPGLAQTTNPTTPNETTQATIFAKGDRGPAQNFTGTVWVKPLVPNDSTYTTVVSNVLFEPGARTFWHYHPAG